MAEKIAQQANGGVWGRRITRFCKGEDAKAPIRSGDMAEVDGLGIRETDDGRGMKALSDHKSLGEMLVVVPAGEDRAPIVRRRSGRITPVPDEIGLRVGRVGCAV